MCYLGLDAQSLTDSLKTCCCFQHHENSVKLHWTGVAAVVLVTEISKSVEVKPKISERLRTTRGEWENRLV